MRILSSRYAAAVAYAVDVHTEQLRRGTEIPYAAHVIGVSALVLEAGGDEDLAIAALLHDAAEDHGGEARLSDIEARFGPRVARVVRECSDSLTESEQDRAPWEQRKRDHLYRLADASADSLTVWAADKVHNARALITDIELEGVAELEKFHAPPDRILWYYRANLALLEGAAVPSTLMVPLRDCVGRLAVLIEG